MSVDWNFVQGVDPGTHCTWWLDVLGNSQWKYFIQSRR